MFKKKAKTREPSFVTAVVDDGMMGSVSCWEAKKCNGN